MFGAVEAITVGVVSIWFAFGSLAALISAALHAPDWLQLVVFLTFSALSLIITRPLIKTKILLRTSPTNFDMLIGEKGITEDAINNISGTGTVKIHGKVWSAKSANGDIIPAGSVVSVSKIEGVKLIVELYE